MSFTRFISGTVIASVVLCAPLLRAADDAIGEDARRHFNAGVNLLQDPDGARYEDAYREFEAAYAASQSPKILGNIGYCALKLERDGEAITAYARYLKEVKDVDPAEGTQVARDLATLRAGLVRVTLTVDSTDATVVDRRLPVRGDSVTNLYGPVNGSIEIGVRPGHHIIEARLHGETREPWEFDAEPGSKLSHAFVRKPPAAEPPRSSSPRVLPWVVMGAGAAGLIGGGIAGVITLSKVNTIANACPHNTCPATYQLKPAQDDVHRLETVTDTLFIAGGVVTAAGLGLLLATSGSSAPSSPASASRTASARPVLACSLSGCVASMSGAF
jgi:hypothetical protein